MRPDPPVGEDAAPAAASGARDPTIRVIAQRSRHRRRERRDDAGALGGPAWPIGRGPRPPAPWTESRVIEAIRDWAREMGGPPVPEEWGRKGRGPVSAAGLRWERERPRWPSAPTVRARCGSWAAAIEKAGFTPPRARPEGTCAERIEAAQRMVGAGHSAAVIADHLGVATSTVHRYLRPGYCRGCGSPVVSSSTGYCLACITRAQNTTLYSREEIIERLREWHAQTGRAPRAGEWRIDPDAPNRYQLEFPHWPPQGSAETIFGSWHAAVRGAGLEPVRERWAWTRQEAIDALLQAAVTLGRSPTVADSRRNPWLPTSPTARRYFGSWHGALTAAGLPVNAPAPRDWDRPAIIEAFRDFAAEHGRSPQRRDFDDAANEGRYPSSTAVTNQFGSWNDAVRSAGLKPTRDARPAWDRASIVDALRRLAADLGSAPRRSDLDPVPAGARYPSAATVERHFGSFQDALIAAGLQHETVESWPREAIVDALRDGARRLGRTPRAGDANDDPLLPPARLTATRFGSWGAAIRAAGLDLDRRSRRWEEQAIIDALRHFAAEHGRTPLTAELTAAAVSRAGRYPTARTVTRYFSSWTRALAAAGLDPVAREQRWDPASIVEALQQFAAEHGHAPQARDLAGDPRYPNANTVARYLGSWAAAIDAAGLELHRATRQSKPPRESPSARAAARRDAARKRILEALRTFAEIHGRRPRVRDWNAATRPPRSPNLATVRRHFGTWNSALTAAGIDPWTRSEPRSERA